MGHDVISASMREIEPAEPDLLHYYRPQLPDCCMQQFVSADMTELPVHTAREPRDFVNASLVPRVPRFLATFPITCYELS
jgi:hypothetical protein